MLDNVKKGVRTSEFWAWLGPEAAKIIATVEMVKTLQDQPLMMVGLYAAHILSSAYATGSYIKGRSIVKSNSPKWYDIV